MDRKAIEVFEWEMKELNAERDKYTQIFDASVGIISNKFSYYFRPLTVSRYLEKTK